MKALWMQRSTTQRSHTLLWFTEFSLKDAIKIVVIHHGIQKIHRMVVCLLLLQRLLADLSHASQHGRSVTECGDLHAHIPGRHGPRGENHREETHPCTGKGQSILDWEGYKNNDNRQ